MFLNQFPTNFLTLIWPSHNGICQYLTHFFDINEKNGDTSNIFLKINSPSKINSEIPLRINWLDALLCLKKRSKVGNTQSHAGLDRLLSIIETKKRKHTKLVVLFIIWQLIDYQAPPSCFEYIFITHRTC